MTPAITLYGFGYSRSARCKWTLLELGLPFEEIDDRDQLGTAALKELQPQGKLPACLIDGEALFESAAICTHLCDLVPDAGLIGRPGSRARALHAQWTSFAQSELESYLWHSAKHMMFYPEEKRVEAVLAPNREEFRNGAAVLDAVLAETDFLVDNRFSVTDIIIGWTVNWGRRLDHLDGFANLARYLDRLFLREHCTLNPE